MSGGVWPVAALARSISQSVGNTLAPKVKTSA
jgi:hypothetical protein